MPKRRFLRNLLEASAICSLVMAVGPPATATAQGSVCDTPPSTEIVLQNRSTVFWIGGHPILMASPTLGLFRIDSADRRVSLRFRSSVQGILDSVWIYLHEVTVTGGAQLQMSVKTDQNGMPVPPGPVTASASFTPQAGWQRVTIPGPLELKKCDVYHIVLEPVTAASFTADEYVEFTTLVSRYPLEYQAEDPSSPAEDSFYDLQLAFMFQDPPDPLVTQWKEDHYQFLPIFTIECADGTRFGQPYETQDRQLILGNSLWGQQIAVDQQTTVNYVAAFVEGLQGGDGFLDAEIYSVSSVTPLRSTRIVRNRPGVTNRAHWFGGSFEPIDLPPGSYYLMLRSVPDTGPSTTTKGYLVSACRSVLPAGLGGEDGTYGSGDSHVVFSPDGGSTFFTQPGRPDMGFLLGNLTSTLSNPFAIFDEGGVYHSDNSAALVASPGEFATYRIEPRNIGPIAGQLLFEVVEESIQPTVIWAGSTFVNPNSDASAGLSTQFAIPTQYTSGDLFSSRVRLGHLDSTSGIGTWDDEVSFEIRIQ